MLKSKLYTRII